MNERLQQWWQTARTYYVGLSTRTKTAMAIGAGVITVGGIAAGIALKDDPYQVLYSDLQQEDARAVIRKLSEKNIAYQANGDTVLVPKSQVHQARMQLAKDGIPGNDVVGFEKFDNSTLGMSSYVQRIQYVRAVQGELIRSIQKLSSVKSARVHISIPPKKTFLEEEDPPKASVVLELKTGQAPTKTEMQGVAHLVASAVEGLKVNQVTIVDTKGSFLHRPEDGSGQGSSAAMLDMQRSIETEYERRVEDILTPVIGFGKVRAKVTAEIDPSRVNTTEESYDADKAAIRTQLKNGETNTGQRPNPIGIPGSRSNLPGAEAQNPGVPMATNNNEKNVEQNTYAIPKKVQITDKPSGNIKRLTVAVVVDGYYAKPEGATTEAFTPRTPEELKKLQELVANAVGYDPERRDSINVTSLPFKASDVDTGADVAPAHWWQREEVVRQLLRNGLIATLLLLFFTLILRPLLKYAFKAEEAAKAAEAAKDAQAAMENAVALLPRTVAELEAVQNGEQPAGALSQGNPALAPDPETPEKSEEADLKKRILEKLERSPRKGLRIIQEWLEEEIAKEMPKLVEG